MLQQVRVQAQLRQHPLNAYSFPEQQNTETAEDLAFNFAVTNNSPDIKLASPNAPHGSADTFYGTCVFRQEFDHSMKRSFNQRTLVMISHHNFPSFHHRLLQKMTETGVISDPVTLQAAYNQMLGVHQESDDTNCPSLGLLSH
jgi:hypothetical protein